MTRLVPVSSLPAVGSHEPAHGAASQDAEWTSGMRVVGGSGERRKERSVAAETVVAVGGEEE